MTDGRWGATALLVLALTASGCTTDDGGSDTSGQPSTETGSASSTTSETSGPAADEAAATYLADLESYQRQVARAAARTASATRADSAEGFSAAQRLFAAALEAAPELEVVDGGADASESYARTALVAENVQGFVDEHAWMNGWDIAENIRVHNELYTIGGEQYDEGQRISAAYVRAMNKPGDSSTKLKKALSAELAAELQSAADTRGRVEAIAGQDTFTPSLRDHLVHEIDVAVAEGERYLEYAQTMPVGTIKRDLFRNGFSSGLALPSEAVSNAPALRTVNARELLADGLSELIAAAEGGEGKPPVAGDIYRELILRLFKQSSDFSSDNRLALDEQLYWLWHIREIEDTPVEAFDNARLTIKLQGQGGSGTALVNVDSRFDELAAMFATMVEIIREGPDSMAANKPWIIELLDRPYPDALGDVVGRAREAATLLSDDGSQATAELMAVGPGLLKSLKRAADDLDDRTVFRADFRAAVNGTRPPTTS